MVDLNIVRKEGPTLWPWLIGLVVLGLLIWAISELVNTDRDNATMAEADSNNTAITAVPPGAAAPPAGATPAAEQNPDLAPAPVAALMPLGTEDVGQRVSAGGEAMTDGANGGFWLKTENRAAIWVRSTQRVKQGQQIQGVVGLVQQARPDQPGAALPAELASSKANSGLAFSPGFYLDASPAASGGPAPAEARAGSGIAGARSDTVARSRAKARRRSGTAG